MDNHTARMFAFVMAEVARVEGMKAENAHRAACGEGPAYGEEAFGIAAAHIESLAREIN